MLKIMTGARRSTFKCGFEKALMERLEVRWDCKYYLSQSFCGMNGFPRFYDRSGEVLTLLNFTFG